MFFLFKEIVVDGCQLKEPVYDYTFNLTALNSLGRTVHNERGDRIEFNVCGGLSRSCGDKTNVGACLTKNDGKAFTLGNTCFQIFIDWTVSTIYEKNMAVTVIFLL